MMTPIAWLVRHAESVANAGGRTKTTAETPLSELGRQQAAAIQLPLRPSRIVVSRYLRTQQTAEPLIEQYPDVPVEVWPVEEFTFLNGSKYQDTTEAERAPFAQEYIDRNDPLYRDGGDAESFYDLLERALETFERLKQDRQVVVFTHGRFLQAIRWVFEGRRGTPREFFEWMPYHPIPNASITTLSLTPFRTLVLGNPASAS